MASSSVRLLVVDDDLSFVTFVCAALENMGLATDVALTGHDAGLRLKKEAYGGVLLDLSLPDMSGLDVLRTMRRHGDITPVAVLTGAGTIVTAVQAMKLGVVDFLEKPVRLVALSALVGSIRSRSPSPRLPVSLSPIDRLALAVVVVVRHGVDVPTVREWGALIGRSESSLYALFEVNGISAKASLDLARLLRVVVGSTHGEGLAGLSCADPRTVTRLLDRAGLKMEEVRRVSAFDLLSVQRLVLDPQLVGRIRDLIG